MVGRLQSNKAGRAVRLFDAIQSIDSLELAERVARAAHDAGHARYPVHLQVNVDADAHKAGFSTQDLRRDLAAVAALPGLELVGLMTVGALVARAADARPTFARLRGLSEELRSIEPRLGVGLSMGMSDDFEVAIEEGATVVRLGRVLFGARQA
jgi:pyridoxal phosphate enzyme (YggS family)